MNNLEQNSVTVVEISGLVNGFNDRYKSLALELWQDPNIDYIRSTDSRTSANLAKTITNVQDQATEDRVKQYASFLADQVKLHSKELNSIPKVYAVINNQQFDRIVFKIEQAGLKVSSVSDARANELLTLPMLKQS